MMRPRTFTKGRLVLALILLVLFVFNASSIQRRRRAQALFDQREQNQKLLKDIRSLGLKFANQVGRSARETHAASDTHAAIKARNVSDDDLLAAFPLEFIVVKHELQAPNETKVSLFVPEKGEHRIRIEIWEQESLLCDQFFKIDSGRRSDILFRVGDDWIEIEFPGQPPIRNNLSELKIAPTSADLKTPRLFVSPNQAPWRKGVAFFGESRVGVLSQFRFNSTTVDRAAKLHNAVAVRISAKSAGPMSAAADDWLTMLRLTEMIDGNRQTIPYRYENGRYLFEEVPHEQY